VRISGGEFRGRVLSVPKGLDVRPTQDRVREALFSMLQNDICGARFLDLFAGSGSVGLEALSRGAAEVAFVEQAPRSLASLARNIAMLKVEDRCRVIRADVYAWLSAALNASNALNGLNASNALNGLNAPNGLGFDIAYADPPYAVGAEHGYATVLARLAEGGFVKPAGLFIAEMTAGQAPDSAPAWELCRDRTYGQTRLAIYRRR
jgi:16S rRNA (guanine966-N2)-methyltransferase